MKIIQISFPALEIARIFAFNQSKEFKQKNRASLQVNVEDLADMSNETERPENTIVVGVLLPKDVQDDSDAVSEAYVLFDEIINDWVKL